MSGENLYLGMVIVAFGVFTGALAVASLWARTTQRKPPEA